MDEFVNIVTLYRYFSYAALMRHLFRQAMTEADIQEWLELMKDELTGPLHFLLSEPGMYMMYSYSGMYLVIEGWTDLKLKDNKIEELIKSPFVDRLRLFRNATFHYQKDINSWKHFQFFGTEEEGTEKWITQLYSEFSRFFRENTLPLPEDLRESIAHKSHSEVARAISKYWKS